MTGKTVRLILGLRLCGFFTDFQVKTPSGWWKAGWTCRRTWVENSNSAGRNLEGRVHCVVVLAPGSLEAAVVSSRKPTLSDLWHEGDGLLIDTHVMIDDVASRFTWCSLILIDYLACAVARDMRNGGLYIFKGTLLKITFSPLTVTVSVYVPETVNAV